VSYYLAQKFSFGFFQEHYGHERNRNAEGNEQSPATLPALEEPRDRGLSIRTMPVETVQGSSF
jgi:hypothetical protein